MLDSVATRPFGLKFEVLSEFSELEANGEGGEGKTSVLRINIQVCVCV